MWQRLLLFFLVSLLLLGCSTIKPELDPGKVQNAVNLIYKALTNLNGRTVVIEKKLKIPTPTPVPTANTIPVAK